MSTHLSILENLLAEISWDGSTVKRYHNGGLGFENVLTSQVLQGLDFLPRQYFLSAVIDSFTGNIEDTKRKLLQQVEEAKITFRAYNYHLKPSEKAHHKGIGVQPDGVIETSDVFVFIEAKGFKRGSFKVEQLAREYIILLRETTKPLPLLLLILPKEPPISVVEYGTKSIKETILNSLEVVTNKTEGSSYSLSELENKLDSSVAWITWSKISQVLTEQLELFKIDNSSTQTSIERITKYTIDTIKRHSELKD